MLSHTRRSFLSFMGKAAALSGFAMLAGQEALSKPKTEKKGFVHQVYFWLKNPQSAEDKAKLISALQKLAQVKTIQEYHIGEPPPAERDVVDASYSVSWMLMFKDKAAQDNYQTDPIHLKFVEENAALWDRVVVYDAVNAV